ncbi:1327_t:CDS:10, partial [Gigaspora margarita]
EELSIMSSNILVSTEIPIKEGLLFEKHSKALLLEDTQTLMLEYKKSQTRIYSLNRKISNLQKHIEELENKIDEKITILDKSNLLETNKKSLSVGFDCSWSHIRNANQASGELIYQEILSNYFHKPIIAFHVVEKARIVKDEGVVKTIYQGNFDKSSRQMKYAILIEILNQISLLLEKADLHLNIYIDGDLDSNKTLVNISIISNIYANLKHLTRNIRNSLQNHIMCWFCGCIYSAALWHADHDLYVPTKEETCIMQEISLQKEINKPISLEEHIKIIAKEIFKFTELRPEQMDAIKYYIENKKDTLVIMKTRTIEHESKIMEEIALRFTCLLYVIPKKLLLNSSLKKLCNRLQIERIFPKVQIMTLIATLSQDNVYALKNNLNISKDNFEIAKDIYEALNLKIEEIQLDIYHEQLQENHKANVMKKWNQGKTHLMIAISAFGMDIDMPDIRLVLHYNCSINMKKDIRTDYTIIAENRESNENNDENTLDRELYLAKCHFQLVSQYHVWPNDPIPPECKLCDNYIRREKDNVVSFNAQLDILELLRIIILLCEKNTKQIILLDVLEVFGCSKGLNLLDFLDCEKPKLLNTRALAELALTDL